MSALPKEALRRGWCPSTLKPMETGDGWLVRLHPPGAKLAPAGLIRVAALALEHGNGLLEISARANLQIRGVTPESHPILVEQLLAERLVDEHDGDGPQRLTLVSPVVDADLIDAIALSGRIEDEGRTVSGLPPKFSIIVDDGSPCSLGAFPCDLRLVGIAEGLIALGLADRHWRGPLPEAEAAAAVGVILRGFAKLHSAAPERVRRMRDLPDDLLASLTELPETALPARRPPPQRAGLFAMADDSFAALIGLPFGRCDAGTLTQLAATAPDDAEIRLSPWRGLAFRGLAQSDAERLLRLADTLGLIIRDDDPRLSVQACAGSPACSRAEAPTMADAATLAEATANLLAEGATLHVSGCVKSCAHPGTADLTLVGHGGRYDVIPGETARDKAIATLDLSALLARLQPGEDIHARLSAAVRTTGPRD